jgi:predicted nucleic acid-binding protein
MTLMDTPVWVKHSPLPSAKLVESLKTRSAGMHPFVTGELAAGNLKNRAATLADLNRLPQVPLAGESEVHHLLESRNLWGTGLGWVDLHLLAAALLAGWKLLTADRAMKSVAHKLGIAHPEN